MSAPALSIQTNGGSPTTADNLNTYEQTCDTVAELRSFVGISGIQVSQRGYLAPNDGGQGVFYWNAGGVAADDGGITTVVPYGSGTGAWSRLSGVATLLQVTTAQKASLTAGAGWMVFDTTLGKACVYNGSVWQIITSA